MILVCRHPSSNTEDTAVRTIAKTDVKSSGLHEFEDGTVEVPAAVVQLLQYHKPVHNPTDDWK